MMTRDQAIEIACAIASLAWQSRDPEAKEPSDGFCGKCPAGRSTEWDFRNTGKSLRYVERAVREKLVRDGIEPDFESLKALDDLWKSVK